MGKNVDRACAGNWETDQPQTIRFDAHRAGHMKSISKRLSSGLIIKPADYSRWRQELHFTLFGGAMLIAGLEPFLEIAETNVETMLAAIPDDQRGLVEQIYNRSKSYVDDGQLRTFPRQKPALYRRLYVKREAFIDFCRSQGFKVPRELAAHVPVSQWYRQDRTPIAESDIAKRDSLEAEISPQIKNGKVKLKRFFDGSGHNKGELPPAHAFRIYNAAGQPKKGRYDRPGVLKQFEKDITDAKKDQRAQRIHGHRYGEFDEA